MLSLTILKVKDFMSKLLINEIFDQFLLVEASITMLNQFIIDGHLHKEFYDNDAPEQEELKERKYSLWKEVRPVCFNLIKGSKTPLQFKFVFQLSNANVSKLLTQGGIPLNETNINGLYLNIKFDGKNLSCTSATSVNVFTLDKTLDYEWDNCLKKFFVSNEIPFEEI